ncbi:MAG: hypothetical protein KJ645_12580 [Planctomycetes bacterium]|nr:hypothetical protein [Planctomycetota bacterium]
MITRDFIDQGLRCLTVMPLRFIDRKAFSFSLDGEAFAIFASTRHGAWPGGGDDLLFGLKTLQA